VEGSAGLSPEAHRTIRSGDPRDKKKFESLMSSPTFPWRRTGSPRTCQIENCACKTKDKFDRLPIHLAARMGDLRACERLCQHNPSYKDAPDGQDRTPLMHAASRDQWKVVEWLVRKESANTGLRSADGRRAINYAPAGTISLHILQGEPQHGVIML
jgi:hypothetical protein